MEKINDIIKFLEDSNEFKEWTKENDCYLVNLFNELNNNLEISSNWKLGYYCPKLEKVVTFFIGNEIIKTVDDILGDKDHIPKFIAENDSLISDVLDKIKKYFKEKYPKNTINKGWVVVNTENKKINYTITLLSGQHVIILNIDAQGEVNKDEKHALMDWMQSVKGERKSGM